MRYRDTKGWSLTPFHYDGPGVLLDDATLQDEMAEVAEALGESFPDSPIPDRVEALLAKARAIRVELLTEWEVLAPALHMAGMQLENNVLASELARFAEIREIVEQVGKK